MKCYTVDAFTNKPFTGNPAGVCFPEQTLNDAFMQNIAKEFGLSETAFVQPTDKPGIYSIRYFSPKKEIPLCGHATLSSAKVLFSETDLDTIHFITGEQLDLFISKRGQEIVMEFPVYETEPATVPDALLHALGLRGIINCVYSPKNKIILLQIEDSAALAALRPDFKALVASYTGINGVLVTAAAKDGDYDYHYRYFWPWAGTDEDPVTGGVQTFLAKYWSRLLNKTEMRAFQSSERTGYMSVELKGDKVFLCSDAVIILKGELDLFKE
jgi:PhzF family phenazine biosynthesis protein